MIAKRAGKKLLRARLIAVLAATAATATVLFTPSSAMAYGGVGYEAINQNSGLCMGVSGGSSAIGAAVVQFPCIGHGDQFWSLYPFPGSLGTYGLVYNASMNNRCLGLKNSGTGNGTLAVSVLCQSADWAQLWEQVEIPGLGYVLVNYKSGRCLGVPGSSLLPIQLVLWDCNGHLDQIWYAGASKTSP